MSKHDEWFKSSLEAFEQEPNWDIEIERTTSKSIPVRDKTTKNTQKK